MAVKHIPMDANKAPTRNDKGIISRDSGSLTSRKIETTRRIIEALITLLVDPHNISPSITSSMFKGVAMIASKVF